MTVIGAIDVGSNAIRLAIAKFEKNGDYKTLLTEREAVRLGSDAFSSGVLSESLCHKTVEAFLRFKKILKKNDVKHVRAVATSAMREAQNSAALIATILKETEIEIEIISGTEEARLVILAVSRAIDLNKGTTLLIDIGGGSVETTVIQNGKTLSIESAKMGTLRLRPDAAKFEGDLKTYADSVAEQMRKAVGDVRECNSAGTGGNIEEIGELRQKILGEKNIDEVSLKEIEQILTALKGMSYSERVKELKLKPDRADVIIPATLVVHSILKRLGINRLKIPHVALKDGVLLDSYKRLCG